MPRFTFKPSSLAAFSKGKFVASGRFHVAVPTTLIVEPVPSDKEPADHTVVMDLDIIEGRLACTRLELQVRDGGPTITAEALRRVPVARYIRDAVAAQPLGVVSEVDPANMAHRFPFVWPDKDFADAGMTDDVLRAISRIYHWALITGEAPLGVLEREYDIPRGKASRWISVARRRGLIEDGDDGAR